MVLNMRRWIKFKDGKFGGVYEGDTLNWFGKEIDESTDDATLFDLGVLRLEERGPEYPDIPHYKVRGPFYELDSNGRATAVEKFEWVYESFDEIKRAKIHQWYMSKDTYMRRGVLYGGRQYDMRFRNISYLALISSMISSGTFPEKFEWFDSSGNLVNLTQDQMEGLIVSAIDMIRSTEMAAQKKLNQLNLITDIKELLDFNPCLEGENDVF